MDNKEQELIPSLPDDLAVDCLLRLPFSSFPAASSVSKRWQRELDTATFHSLRRSLGLSTPLVVLVQASPPLAAAGPANKFSLPSYRLALHSPLTNTWSTLPPIPNTATLPLFCRIAAAGRHLVVLGGLDPATFAASDAVAVYDFASGKWRTGARMPGTRRSFFACAAGAAAVYVAGGHDEEKNALRSAMAYDVVGDTWDMLPDMARERDECEGVVCRGAFRVFGGYATEAQGRFLSSGEAFDVATREWGTVEDDVADGGAAVRVCAAGDDGEVYLCGGGEVAIAGVGKRKEVVEVPAEVKAATHVAGWEGNVMVVGSGRHGGALSAYVLNVAKKTWMKVEVPSEFAGHVRAMCCGEV